MFKVKDYGAGFRIATNVFLIIFSAVLISNIIRNVFSGNAVTFSSFLDYIGNVPQIPFNSLETIHISGTWVILDELRVFLNQLVMPLNIIIFLGANLWNCILYIIFFLKFLFVA